MLFRRNIFIRYSCSSHDIYGLNPAFSTSVFWMTVLVIRLRRIFSRIFWITDETVIGLVVFLLGRPVFDFFFFFSLCRRKSLPQMVSSWVIALHSILLIMWMPVLVVPLLRQLGSVLFLTKFPISFGNHFIAFGVGGL